MKPKERAIMDLINDLWWISLTDKEKTEVLLLVGLDPLDYGTQVDSND